MSLLRSKRRLAKLSNQESHTRHATPLFIGRLDDIAWLGNLAGQSAMRVAGVHTPCMGTCMVTPEQAPGVGSALWEITFASGCGFGCALYRCDHAASSFPMHPLTCVVVAHSESEQLSQWSSQLQPPAAPTPCSSLFSPGTVTVSFQTESSARCAAVQCRQ